MYSCGPPHMAAQKQDHQHEHTFSNYVRIRDVVQKTCLRRWTIGKSGERGSGISVLPARHDDDDDDWWDSYWDLTLLALCHNLVELGKCAFMIDLAAVIVFSSSKYLDSVEYWSLSLLIDPLWPGVVAYVRILSLGQIDCLKVINIE